VLNELIIDPEQGTVDSPLHPSQVRLIPQIPQTLLRLEQLGFGLVIISNQPAAAKGKTTRENLEQAHAAIVEQAQSAGAHILDSYVCFHRAEDHCACRKPGIKLLQRAFSENRDARRDGSWMVGDGITDIEAGQRFGLHTAFIAAHKCDTCQVVQTKAVKEPTLWAKDLAAFTDMLTAKKTWE